MGKMIGAVQTMAREHALVCAAAATGVVVFACWLLDAWAVRRHRARMRLRRRKRVVVVGGGFAGAEVARVLQHHARRGLCTIDLIDESGELEFTPVRIKL